MRIIYNIELYFSWLECHPDKMKVVGSSPISSTIFIEVWPNWLRFLFWEQEIVGSSPVTSTILPLWRNRQTRLIQNQVFNGVRVRIPLEVHNVYNCRCSTMVSALVFQTRDASSILVICSIYNCSDGVVGGARRLAKAKAFASSILVHCSTIF